MYFNNQMTDAELKAIMAKLLPGSNDRRLALVEVLKARRLKKLFTPERLNGDGKQTLPLTIENIPHMTDPEIQEGWRQIGDDLLAADLLLEVEKAEPLNIRFQKIILQPAPTQELSAPPPPLPPVTKENGESGLPPPEEEAPVLPPAPPLAKPLDDQPMTKEERKFEDALNYVRYQPNGQFEKAWDIERLITTGQTVEDMVNKVMLPIRGAVVFHHCLITDKATGEKLARAFGGNYHHLDWTLGQLLKKEGKNQKPGKEKK